MKNLVQQSNRDDEYTSTVLGDFLRLPISLCVREASLLPSTYISSNEKKQTVNSSIE